MPIEIPDFTNLSLVALFTFLIVIAAIDVGFNIALAISRGEFSPLFVLEYLRTHILLRVFVIGALGILGHGIPALDVPAIPAISLAATASLSLYLLETVASLREATRSTSPG